MFKFEDPDSELPDKHSLAANLCFPMTYEIALPFEYYHTNYHPSIMILEATFIFIMHLKLFYHWRTQTGS